MDLMQGIIARAKANKQRIVLPEGTDGVADIILIGNPDEIHKLATDFGLGHISGATIINPKEHAKKEDYINLLVQIRQKKGMTPEKAAVLVEDPLYLACLIIKAGDADGEMVL